MESESIKATGTQSALLELLTLRPLLNSSVHATPIMSPKSSTSCGQGVAFTSWAEYQFQS